MKIAIVVHGRFHAFDLARALLDQGHDVTVFTNYPKWAVARFGIRGDKVRSFWPHGVASRIAWSLRERARMPYPEAFLHPLFGRWAAAQLQKEQWDVVHSWSGVSEEILSSLPATTLKLVMRGSAHIRAQARILDEERIRARARIDHPSRWIIAREEREYALADRVVVLSTFARNSFWEQGVARDKLWLLPLGANLEAFRPQAQLVEARRRRILSGEPLRILYVGALSFQKGLLDTAVVLNRLDDGPFHFRFVGPLTCEARPVVVGLRRAEFVPKQAQRDLPRLYAWGDLFFFPTLQDGFAAVLAQAQASALPILTTTNCCGPDLIRHGETGWVLPIRSPEAFVERLRWCDAHRPELAAMVQNLYYGFRPRDWLDVAADFESLCKESSITRVAG